MAFATPLVRSLAVALFVSGCLASPAFTKVAFFGLPNRLGQHQLAQTADSPINAPQIARDGWKDCTYNDNVIRCKDLQQGNALQIVWIDGIRSTFVRKPASQKLPSYWGDRYGGLWRRELLPQGNTLLTNLATGNRILVPLRYPCKPPLKGEVGYCRY